MSNKKLVLGIDIGGTKTAFGFVDRSGNIISAKTIETKPCDSAEKYISRLHHQIEEMRTGLASYYRLCGIGIGAPNANCYRGTIEQAVHLNWGKSVHLVGLIRNYYKIPVSITNDANTAAIGEMLFGKACEMKNFIAITLGTGLGSGVVINGLLLNGSDGFARELGHTVVDPVGRQCRCGKKGCLETYVDLVK